MFSLRHSQSFFSPARTGKLECLDSMPDKKGCCASFWARLCPIFQPVDLFAIPSPFLDGANYSKHVCNYPRCALCLIFFLSMLTLALVNFATSLLVDRSPNSRRPSQASLKLSVALLTFTAIVFRAEVVLLLAPLCLQLLFTKRISFLDLMRIGLISGGLSIGESYSFLYSNAISYRSLRPNRRR